MIVAAPRPCKRAEGDQRLVAPRKAAQERTEREDDRADQEDAPAAEEVGRTPSEQQESAEDERVGADHPLEVLLREPEVDLDRRQRDVHDRDVEDDHELHREDERECEPFLAIRGNHVSPFVVSQFRRRGDPTKDTCDLQVKTSILEEDPSTIAEVAKTYDQYCPVAHALDLVGERWSLLIVRELLEDGQLRYSDLHARLDGCGTNILAARLKALEQGGVVRRHRLDPPAASWVYELTEYGAGAPGRAARARPLGRAFASPACCDG